MVAHIEMLLGFLLWVAVTVAPVAILLTAVYYGVTWPFRFLERARFLLELVSAALADGRSPERMLVELSRHHERAFGSRLHLLAVHLERGLTLGSALALVPKLMPPGVAAMIKVGEQIGSLSRVLPAARRVLEDGMSEARSAQYHVVALATATLSILAWVLWALGTWAFPKFEVMLLDMDDGRGLYGWMLFEAFAGNLGLWIAALAVFILVMWGWTLLCLGGIERMFWTQSWSPDLAARIWHRLPWRCKRLKRDFSFLLALLLDSDVPEERAVAMAAFGTADPGMKRRAWAVIEDLRHGLWLPGAIRHMDDDGELAWRFRHAIYRKGGFQDALKTWQDALEAAAVKEEKIAIDATNLAVVLFSGLMVGLVTVSVFQFVTTLTDLTSPW